MIALFCETPYQLMNGLNLVYNEFDEECVLFITRDMFCSDTKFEIDFATTEKSRIKKVIYVERYVDIQYPVTLGQRIKFKMWRIFSEDKRETLLKYIPDYDFNITFHRIIAYKYSAAAYALEAYMGYSLPVDCVEEGIGEYILSQDESACKIMKYCECKYLTEPSLYPQTKETVKGMPKLENCQELMDEYERLFHFRKDIGKYGRTIYFDQPLAADYHLPGIAEKERACFEILEQYSGTFTVKVHPRGSMEEVPGGTLLRTITPWECIAGELPEMEDQILISVVSTCLATPKFLYGKEPYLIILIRLFEKEFQNIYPESHYYERAIQFFENVCHIYKNKNKVFLPADLEELEQIIKALQ